MNDSFKNEASNPGEKTSTPNNLLQELEKITEPLSITLVPNNTLYKELNPYTYYLILLQHDKPDYELHIKARLKLHNYAVMTRLYHYLSSLIPTLKITYVQTNWNFSPTTALLYIPVDKNSLSTLK